jgi:Protein of unknown function (DUF3108)
MKLFHILTLSLALICGATTQANEATSSTNPKRNFKLPPSATLSYAIKAKQRGFPLNGEGKLIWQSEENKYLIVNEVRASMFGKIQESKSEGKIDQFGLAPLQFTEKRYRKDPTTTQFDRDTNQIIFSQSDLRHPIKGGEQDRISVIWQIISLVRSTPAKFVADSNWSFIVAGRRDAEPWKFKVLQQETIETPLGKFPALHLIRLPPPDSPDQQLDIWLAPSLNWYPLRLRFSDADGDFLEQNLEKIEK